METVKLLNNVAGTGSSASYFIENDVDENEVQLFINFSSGTVVIEASADKLDFAPVNIETAAGLAPLVLSSSAVVPLDLAEGTYLRIAYDSATALSFTVKPKKQRQ